MSSYTSCSVEVCATDEQEIDPHGMQRDDPDPGTFRAGSKVRLRSG